MRCDLSNGLNTKAFFTILGLGNAKKSIHRPTDAVGAVKDGPYSSDAASGNWRAIKTNLCCEYDGHRGPVEQRRLVLPLLDACYCGFNQQRMS